MRLAALHDADVYVPLLAATTASRADIHLPLGSVEATIGIGSYLLAILGLVKAAYSEQPLLWLAVWSAPVALAGLTSRNGN